MRIFGILVALGAALSLFQACTGNEDGDPGPELPATGPWTSPVPKLEMTCGEHACL
jgi:hypothetical protein